MTPAFARFLGKAGLVLVALAVLSVTGAQYARVIGRNLSLEHELHDAQRDVAQLRVRRAEQMREIRRLSDPSGAIPEIHDRLQQVGDDEAIIYVKRRHAEGRP